MVDNTGSCKHLQRQSGLGPMITRRRARSILRDMHFYLQTHGLFPFLSHGNLLWLIRHFRGMPATEHNLTTMHLE